MTSLMRVIFPAAFLLCWIAAAETLVKPQSIRLENDQAYVFSVPLTVETAPRLFVLDGYLLRIYDDSETYSSLDIQLPGAASAVDIYDLDADGTFDVIVVAGTKVLFRAIAPSQAGSAWETIVERTSLYSDTAALPFPQVLAVENEGGPAIALPQLSGFEVWSLDGELRERIGYGQEQDASTVPALPFDVEAVHTDYAGLGNAMVHRVVSQREPGPVDATYDGDYSRGAGSVLSDVSDLPSDRWPRFPLRPGSDDVEVLHAPVPPRFEDTYVRLRTRGPGEGRPGVGPPRRYPGRVLTGGHHLPDFNGDGFVDLVAWKAAVPGASFNTLMGAVRDGTWPVTVSVHLYNPKSRLFEAEPFVLIRTELPMEWCETDAVSGPIRNLLFEDINDDGFIDVGFSTNRDEYSVWNYTPGFNTTPDYVVKADGEIVSIVRGVEFGSERPEKLLLRGPDALYIARFPRD